MTIERSTLAATGEPNCEPLSPAIGMPPLGPTWYCSVDWPASQTALPDNDMHVKVEAALRLASRSPIRPPQP